ncbi:putative membrane protein [Shigella dysenteriae 225-75]|nr:putative membrane protein [Shigella dysenteriae 225-75]
MCTRYFEALSLAARFMLSCLLFWPLIFCALLYDSAIPQ